ncbi:MAG: SpoIIE family protein phosphatase [bacterium]|nr:SpoIIE family protein phosphatase [bacterium]
MPRNTTHLINIVPGDSLPIYRQIMSQIADAIAARCLRPGEKLTSYQELAELLVISPLAVKKAYEDLVLEGLCRYDGDDEYRVAPVSPEKERERAQRGLLDSLLEQELSLQELKLARDIQCRLLPPGRVEGEGFLVAARNYPARFVAGDFYDVIQHADGSVGVVVADVAGKGIGPSLIMASVKAVMPFIAAGRSVEETLMELNRRLHTELATQPASRAPTYREFVALAYARFDPSTGRARIANAGLPDPYLLRPGADPVELEVPWPRLPLGLRPATEYQALEVTLEPGDRLLLYSDGIPEARTRDNEPLGYEVFSALLRSAHELTTSRPAEGWLDMFLESVREATQRGKGQEAARREAAFDDDWTALMIESR